MKKIIYIAIVAVTAIVSYAYYQHSEYSNLLKKLKVEGTQRRINADLFASLGNPVVKQSNKLVCEAGGMLVQRVADSKDKDFWASKSDELSRAGLNKLVEWSESNKKTKKTKADLLKTEQLEVESSNAYRTAEAIEVGLKIPFWVSAEKAAFDYTKSCLGH